MSSHVIYWYGQNQQLHSSVSFSPYHTNTLWTQMSDLHQDFTLFLFLMQRMKSLCLLI
jgi:hypothetical protein